MTPRHTVIAASVVLAGALGSVGLSGCSSPSGPGDAVTDHADNASISIRPVLSQEVAPSAVPEVPELPPVDKKVSVVDHGSLYDLGPATISGADVEPDSAKPEQDGERWGVVITLDEDGTKAFMNLTKKISKYESGDPRKQFATLEDGKVLSVAESQAVITESHIFIAGDFTQQSATAFAKSINDSNS
jgi:preprotein translocase subunit SecD